MKGWGLVIRVQKVVQGGLQGNIPKCPIDKDTRYEGTWQRGTMKYPRENCYHRIEYSVANFLTVLMRKWYLNSNSQLYSYSQRLLEGTDGTRINTNNLVYTWKVKMKEEESIKKNWERNTVTIRIVVVIKLKSYIQELTSSDCADDDSSLDKTILSLLYCHLNPL